MEKEELIKKYTWKDEYNVETESSDQQHQKLIQNITRLVDIITK